MSSSATPGAGGDDEKSGKFSKFMRRASSVLKRDKTKRQSVSGTTTLLPVKDDAATTSTPAPTQAATTSTTPALGAIIPPVTSGDGAKDPSSGTMSIKPRSAMTAAENNKIQEDKARALFAKYNMTLEIGDWTPPFRSDSVRVEKKIRVRIHRHCHRCQTMFGVEKQCAECGHTRCKKCPRTKMTSHRDRKGKSVVTGSLVVDDRYMGIMSSDALNMPYRRTGKDFAIAARRMCHKCQTMFAGNAPQCGACGHQRCAQCPQDPSLPNQLAESSLPRRRQLQPLRVRIRWSCHECQKTFKDLEPKCSKCGHAKCGSCTRDPPLVAGMPTDEDPDLVEKVNARLKSLDISPQAAAA